MKKNPGFTLMELMVVIAIMAILSAIATPNVIQWLRNSQFNASVRDVMGAVGDMRMFAIKSNSLARINFTDGDNSFTTRKLERGTGNSADIQTYELASDIEIESSFSDDELIFNSRGLAVDGSGILIAEGNNTIQIKGAQGQCNQIVVSPHGSANIEECQ